MAQNPGIDVTPSVEALQGAGLMPLVAGLHVEGEPASDDEVLVVEVLLPCRNDIASEIARALTDVRHVLRFITLSDNGRRPGVDYIPT